MTSPESTPNNAPDEFDQIMTANFDDQHPFALELSEKTGLRVGMVGTAPDLSPEDRAIAAAMGAISALKSLAAKEHLRRMKEGNDEAPSEGSQVLGKISDDDK